MWKTCQGHRPNAYYSFVSNDLKINISSKGERILTKEMKNLGLSSLQKAAQHMGKLNFLCSKSESPCQEKATFIFNSQNILGSS